MSDAVAAAVAALNERLGGGGIEGTVRIVIEDEGSLIVDEAGVRAGDGEADCTLTASADTFGDMLGRRARPDERLHGRPADHRRRHGARDAARQPAGMTPAPFHAEVADAPEGARAFWLTASDGVRLRGVVWAGGRRGTAVLFPGRTEFAEKYGRVARALVARGFAVAVIDWRGQGLSDRPPLNPMLGHVEDFRDYQRDVAALLDLVAGLALPGPALLFAHSMGGCIGLRTLLERSDFARGGVLGADVAAAHEGGDARADGADDPARLPRRPRRAG